MRQKQRLSRVFTIDNKLGLHARPAALLVKTACRYQAEIKIRHKSVEIDSKSILGLMTLAADRGTKLEFVASGHDAAEAMQAIEQLFEGCFGEE